MRLLFLLLPFFVFSQNRIEINGKTNVSKFTCTNNKPLITKYHESKLDGYIPAVIKLNVKDFECNNSKMTRDFREMLDIKNHPIITISNNGFNRIKSSTYRSNSKVQMNGNEKTYDISLHYISNGWNLRKIIKLQDFDLKPPTILGGFIYVKDDVLIDIFIEKKI